VVRASVRGARSGRRDEPPLSSRQTKAERFLDGLPRLFEDFPRSEHPRDRRFASIIENVRSLAAENNLALLNHAVSCLDSDEVYAETGVYHGASLIAAMLGNEEYRFLGIDDFRMGEAGLEHVEANLARYGLTRPELLVGDVFEVVRDGALQGVDVGVWYYDADHAFEAQLEGLRVVEPYLATGALVIVDDTDWERVERAMDAYLAEQSRARRILTVDGKQRGAPQWWEGMQVLEWLG
jgi:protein O-GlcNAc transferase